MTYGIEHPTWGRVKVRLDNRGGVEKASLEQIVELSNLPKCKLLLILDTENGFPDKRGLAFPMEDMNYAAPAGPDAYDRQRFGKHNIKDWREWDYAVYIPQKVAGKWEKFQPYVAFIIFHELEHVRIMQQNLQFHRFATWVCEKWKDLTTRACTDVGIRQYEFPLELYCHKRAKVLALRKYGTQFTDTIGALVPRESQEHRELLQFIKSPECDSGKQGNIESIHNEILDLVDRRKNEMRDVIYQFWKEQKNKPDNYAKVVKLPKFLGSKKP
ncbi:MAG: hypothetical protein ACYTEQ_20670 [Planctomycetota bacterium]